RHRLASALAVDVLAQYFGAIPKRLAEPQPRTAAFVVQTIEHRRGRRVCEAGRLTHARVDLARRCDPTLPQHDHDPVLESTADALHRGRYYVRGRCVSIVVSA